VKVKQVSHMRVVSCLCLWNNMIILSFYGCCVCVIAMIISNVSLQWLFPTCHCNDYFQRVIAMIISNVNSWKMTI
jgi:hypothetical protein